MNVKHFVKELNGSRVEGELVRTFLYSVIASILTLAVLYFVSLKNVTDFIPKYGFYLFFAVLSYALIVPVLRQVKAYDEFLCMPGMMIGMTSGMVASFLSGFYVAATNGMFVGSMLGMAIGIVFGYWNGKCCGVMGIMEGVMAGFMGGLMGAMTAFMLFNDHLKTTAVVVFLICAFITVSLNYMIYLETKDAERKRKESHLNTIIITVVLVAITTWIMVFGPRSALFQ
jgi:heme/copper-type cytochrome/quinol oxidase subunit 4